MNTSIAIANKLNILESAIVRVEEWANCLFVVVKGLGSRFVSKKILKKMKNLSAIEGANILASLIKPIIRKASVWTKKGVRIYTLNGYLELQVETASSGQVRYFTKNYEIKAIQELVDTFNKEYKIVEEIPEVTSVELEKAQLEQLYGWNEVADAEADVAREDWDI